MAQEVLIKILEDLKKILLDEKKALIQYQGNCIQEIVSKKEEIIEELEQLDPLEEDNERVILLAKEVRELQETNYMLTQQAINYAETFITAFQETAQKQATYSKEGSFDKNESTGILDQSL